MPQMIPQRRRRFRVNLPVRIWPRQEGTSGDRSFRKPPSAKSTTTENISKGGCYIFLSEKMAVGSEIGMEIQVPSSLGIPRGARIQCRGKVVRVEDGPESKKVGLGCVIERYRFS